MNITAQRGAHRLLSVNFFAGVYGLAAAYSWTESRCPFPERWI
jgi:hypothetical protein